MTSAQRVGATVFMVGFSAVWTRKGVALGTTLPISTRVLAIVGFGAMEACAMWLSLPPQIAGR
jgi:hypothetical protein